MMVSRQTLESWVLDYACKNSLLNVIQEVALRYGGDLRHCEVCEVRLGCASLPHLVRMSDSEAYQTALEIIEDIHKAAPSVVSFKLYAKLNIDLKIMIMMCHLCNVKDRFTLLHGLHRYFPRVLQKRSSMSKEEYREMKEKMDEFRNFLLPLIMDDKKRQTFMKRYEVEDKEKSFRIIRTEMLEFVDGVNKCLPITALDKIMQDRKNHYRPLLLLHHPVDMSKLLQILHGKKTLSSSNLIEILRLAPT